MAMAIAAIQNRNVRIMNELKQCHKVGYHDRAWIAVDETNMSRVYYCFEGLSKTAYENGQYFGYLILPDDFPFHQPGIVMITPNGRFQPNIHLCLSTREWNPITSLLKVVLMIQAYMALPFESMIGGIESEDSVTREYAARSKAFNQTQNVFTSLFTFL